MIYHIAAFFAGFVLDLIFGDPYWMPHPIRFIGNLIGAIEKKLNRSTATTKRLIGRGGLMVVLVLLITGAISAVIMLGAYLIHPILGAVIESIMTYQILATKCLKVESMKVYRELKRGDVEAGRRAVSMIVGRDTQVLDEIGITKAAVETVAENTSDGVIAPMIYTALGGPILGFIYKAINTMDSMVGYKNDRYLHFGRVAARLDDVANYIPSRISAYLMMLGCIFLGADYSVKGAYNIHKRDSRKHASPNSAQTESTCAGAFGIQLAGDAQYFGVVHKKPFIGDPKRPVEVEDIRRANNLLYATAFVSEIICLAILVGVGYAFCWLG